MTAPSETPLRALLRHYAVALGVAAIVLVTLVVESIELLICIEYIYFLLDIWHIV
jgi:hypothetical protein